MKKFFIEVKKSFIKDNVINLNMHLYKTIGYFNNEIKAVEFKINNFDGINIEPSNELVNDKIYTVEKRKNGMYYIDGNLVEEVIDKKYGDLAKKVFLNSSRNR